MATTPVSPKVIASSVTGSGAVLIMYLLSLSSFVDAFPTEVKGALLVLVVAAVTAAAGYAKSDPLRRS